MRVVKPVEVENVVFEKPSFDGWESLKVKPFRKRV